MRRLLLFRHAKAERSIAGTPDRDRALIERGRKDAAKIGGYMATHHLIPERVVLSPATRTPANLETCRIRDEAGAGGDVGREAL